MANIFLQLSPNFKFSQEALQRITNAKSNETVRNMIENFYSEEEQSDKQFHQYINLIFSLLPKVSNKEGKQKLLITLVYMMTKKTEDECIEILKKVFNIQQIPVLSKIKFFSYVYKSFNTELKLKKWVIISSVTLLEKEQKISSFSSFIEHFEEIIEPLQFTQDELIHIYTLLISYLEKHPIYKTLRLYYVIKCLKLTKEAKCKSDQTNRLIAIIIKNGIISEDSISLLEHPILKQNQMYPLLEVFLKGHFQDLNLEEVKKFQKYGLSAHELMKKMKVEAIPRLFSGVKNVGYDQVGEKLKIKKEEVELYIIEAIKQKLVIAKLDQFQETVTFKKVNFRVLRKEEEARFQSELTKIIDHIEAV